MQVPVVGVRLHFAVGELAHLFADRHQRLVETAVADRGVVVTAASVRPAGPGARRCRRISPSSGPRQRRSTTASGEPEIGGTHHLALAHRNAALDLRQVFADPDLDDQFLDLARAVPASCMRSA